MEAKDVATISVGVTAAVLTAGGLALGWWQWRERRSAERLARIKTLFELSRTAPWPQSVACEKIASHLMLAEFRIPHPKERRQKVITTVAFLVIVVLEFVACAWLVYIFSTFPGDQAWAVAVRAGGYVFSLVVWLTFVCRAVVRICSAWAGWPEWPVPQTKPSRLVAAVNEGANRIRLRK